MAYRPVFGEPIKQAEAKYKASKKIPLPDLIAQANALGGDTLSNPRLAVRIAQGEGIPIEQAVIEAHMRLWPW